MSLPNFDYTEPKTLRQACRVLKEQGDAAMIIAGGTDLLQSLKNRLKAPRTLVDMRSVPRLDQISYSKKTGLEIGALVTLRQLASDAIVKEKYPLLAQAALTVGSTQLQAMGTIGGNLCQDTMCVFYNRSPMGRLTLDPCLKLGGKVCHPVKGSQICWATYCGDMAAVLLALDAEIVIADAKGKKTIPLLKLFTGDGKKPNALKRGQIVSEIRVPPLAPQSGGAYLKLRQRKTIDYPLLGVAFHFTMDDGICKRAKLALTGVARAPLLIGEAKRLVGKKFGAAEIAALADAAFKQAHPLNNIVGLPPAYRKEMVKVYVRHAVQQAAQSLGK